MKKSLPPEPLLTFCVRAGLRVLAPLRALAWATTWAFTLGWVAAAGAAPRVPTDPAQVLEHLPMRMNSATARGLAAMRDAVRSDATARPQDPTAAVALGERYFDLAMARGDPRYVGYADAVIQRFTDAPPDTPPGARQDATSAQGAAPTAASTAALWTLRGQLQQYRHGFEPALDSFAQALRADPRYATAHAWRGAIYLVQANYPAARAECDALLRLERSALVGACMGLYSAYTGHAAAAVGFLQQGIKASSDPGNQLWLYTRLGEVLAWRGQSGQAEAAYRRALAQGLDDGYLLAAWADFLLDHKRPAEVVKALASWESSDTLLLRLALAETQLKLPLAAVHTQAVADRFAAARLRADTTHRAEEARFLLQLQGNATAALQVAAANYAVQREPRDARILLEAAVAVRSAAPGQAGAALQAAKPVLDWLASSGFEDAVLRELATTLTKALP